MNNLTAYYSTATRELMVMEQGPTGTVAARTTLAEDVAPTDGLTDLGYRPLDTSPTWAYLTPGTMAREVEALPIATPDPLARLPIFVNGADLVSMVARVARELYGDGQGFAGPDAERERVRSHMLTSGILPPLVEVAR